MEQLSSLETEEITGEKILNEKGCVSFRTYANGKSHEFVYSPSCYE